MSSSTSIQLITFTILLGIASAAVPRPPFIPPPPPPNNNNVVNNRPNNNNNNIPILLTTTLSPILTTNSSPIAYYWNKEEYPNPQENAKFCHRNRTSLLCDPDSILTIAQADKLDQLMNQTTNTSKCYCQVCPEGGNGIKLAIAIANNIYKNYNAPMESASDEFADFLRHRWHYGTCDNTILILLVTSNDITISLGATAKNLFTTNDFFDSLIKAHKTELEQGRFYEGLVAIIGGIRTQIHAAKAPGVDLGPGDRTDRAVTPAEDPRSGTSTALAVVGIVIGFLLVLFVLTGTIILAKKRYEVAGEETAVDPEQKPAGYWSGGEGGAQIQEDDEDDDVENPRNADHDAPPPPLPNTPPPSTPSLSSNTTRKLSTPNGVVEYEPVSIEEDEIPRQPQQTSSQTQQKSGSFSKPEPTIQNRKDSEVGHLHGQDELLDQSSRISTPDLSQQSRL